MSFNIRCANCDDGQNRWENRKALVGERIRAWRPDLLGVQECRDDSQARFLRAALKDYQFYGVRRCGGGDTAIEMAPLFIRKSSFEIVECGHFWLSETPQAAGSRSWGSVFARTATWARLLHRASGRELVFLNTHFDYQPEAIEGAARQLKEWAQQAVRRHPLIVTGDFNANKDSPAYRCLTGDRTLLDAHRLARPEQADRPTFHGFGQPGDAFAIDWMLISKHFEVISAAVDGAQSGNRYPSDHFPIVAELQLREDRPAGI